MAVDKELTEKGNDLNKQLEEAIDLLEKAGPGAISAPLAKKLKELKQTLKDFVDHATPHSPEDVKDALKK